MCVSLPALYPIHAAKHTPRMSGFCTRAPVSMRAHLHCSLEEDQEEGALGKKLGAGDMQLGAMISNEDCI